MALKIESLVRAFKYNGMELVDPGPALTPDAVKEFYANIYPEINNAAIEGPEHVGSKAVYEFRRAVGTKGANNLRQHLAGIVSGKIAHVANAPAEDVLEVSSAIRDCAHDALELFRDSVADPVLPPSALLPILP